MKRSIILALIAASAAHAQVPLHLNHQGRVAVQGTNFHGTGQFKFALVDAGTNMNQTATASGTATLAVTSVSITSGGSGYINPPVVTIAPPDDPQGVQATATATISGGVVTEINITAAGSGYFSNPVQVTIAPPPENIEHQVYWSNAGDLPPNEVPGTSVSLPVDKGLYTVRLGDTAVTNMAAFNPDIFYTPLFLRVWFNDGVHGFQRLTPDQPLGSAPYALQARLAETVAPNSIGPSQIINGSISSSKLASGAVTASLAAAGQAAVASGGVILSSSNNPALVSAGYVKLAPVTFDDNCTEGAAGGGLSSTATVWTGSRLFVWEGGARGGGLYDPLTDTWMLLSGSAPNAPAQRSGASAVWTGTEVIVWGGFDGTANLNNGGRYNPATDTWTPIPASLPNAPTGRTAHTAVWTGSQMIVWGGLNNTSGLLDTGGIFDPQSNSGAGSWTATPVASSTPSARRGHTAVWIPADNVMVIWGGEQASGVTDTAGLLLVGSGGNVGWFVLSPSIYSGAPPAPRQGHTAVWTGTEMIVWGGSAPESFFNDANRLFRSSGTWTWDSLPASNPPTARNFHSAVWTGSEMVVFGGANASGAMGTGARYLRAAGRWEPIASGSPVVSHFAAWTGSQMIINGSPFNKPQLWTPSRRMMLYQKP